MRRLRIKVFGRVQGVAFRHSTQAKANQLGVKGFVKNKSDGSVTIEAEAEEKVLNDFLSWCRRGPDHAIVQDIETKDIPVKNDNAFNIRY